MSGNHIDRVGDGARAAPTRLFHRGRAPRGRPDILASAGTLEARIATTKKEIRRAQKLRYRVFFEEGGAIADPTARLIRRDVCRFDSVCDHLIVVDHAMPRRGGGAAVVGVYRLLRQEVAEAHFGFCSAAEFDIGALIARHPDKRFLELGRACVAPGHRDKRTLELLWRGIWAYALSHRVDAMFGCASLPGVDPSVHAETLAWLREEGGAAPIWRVDAVRGAAAPYPAATPAADPRATLRALPPLIKGYWRLGAIFGGEPVVDWTFGATDVFVVLPIEQIRARYLAHFAPRDEAPPLAA